MATATPPGPRSSSSTGDARHATQPAGEYSTRDATLCAFLVYRGHALARIVGDAASPLATFFFQDSQNLRRELLAYTSGEETPIDLVRFFEIRKDLLRRAQAGGVR